MAKHRASEATVMAFLEAVYPGASHLVAAAFDEETVLRDATAALASATRDAEDTMLTDLHIKVANMCGRYEAPGGMQCPLVLKADVLALLAAARTP